jgi:hypothetical protein
MLPFLKKSAAPGHLLAAVQAFLLARDTFFAPAV